MLHRLARAVIVFTDILAHFVVPFVCLIITILLIVTANSIH